MLPIQAPVPVAATPSKPRPAGTAPGRRFGVGLSDSTPPEASAGNVAEAALAGILALQEGSATRADAMAGAAARDRQARRRGRDLLDALAALQRAMLGGAADDASLQALAALAAAPAEAADPALRRILADIRLRARVELARYEIR